MKSLTIRRGLCVAALAVAPLALSAQQVAVPGRAPADFAGYVSISDTTSMWTALSASPLRGQIDALMNLPVLVGNPEFSAFKTKLDEAGTQLGFSVKPDDLLTKTVKGLDIYFAKPGADGLPQALAVVAFDSPAHAQAVADRIVAETGKTMTPPSADPNAPAPAAPAPTVSEVNGVSVRSYADQHLHLGVVGNNLVAGSSMDFLTSSLTATGSAGVTARPDVVSAFSKLPSKTGQMSYWFGEGAFDALEDLMGDEAAAFKNMGLKNSAGVFNFTADRIDSVSYTGMDAQSEAVKKLMSIKPGKSEMAMNLSSKTALFAFAANLLDGPTLLQAAEEQTAADPDASAMMQQVMAGMDQGLQPLGLSFKDDVVPAFGPDVMFTLNSFSVIAFPNFDLDLMLASTVRDPAKAANVMAKLEKAVVDAMAEQTAQFQAPPPEPKEELYNGTKIRSVSLSTPMMPLAFAFTHATTADGRVLIGVSEKSVKNALDRSASSTGLKTGEGWSALAKSLPSESNTLMVLNMRELGTTLASIAPMAMGMGAMDGDQMAIGMQAIEIIKSMGVIGGTSSYTPDGQIKHFTIAMR